MKTLKGARARYEVRYADGTEIEDHEFGRAGQLCATIGEAQRLAEQHRAAGSDVRIVPFREDGEE